MTNIYYDREKKAVVLEYDPRDAAELACVLLEEGRRRNDKGWLSDAEEIEKALDVRLR